MKKYTLLLFAFISTSILSAQQVTGLIKDEGGKPVSGSTVSLLRAKDSATVKLATTGEKGTFQLPATEGSYLISATYVGHATAYSSIFTVSTVDINVPDITIAKAVNATLKGVTVTAKKPMVEVKADKTILNVEGTINAVGNDGLELLRKSPGVLVDKDDNLSLSGKNGVQVYIDGRPSPLSGKDLSDYLKTLQSSQIEAIEIITNPSARYEAAGNAGIINIRLKKNKAYGTNGSVNAGWNIGTYAKYNSGVSLNHRNGKINLFGTYNYNRGRNANYMEMYRETVTDSLFQQRTDMLSRNRSHGFKAGLDYFVSKKSTFGFIVNGNINENNFTSYGRADISDLASKSIDRYLIANNRNDMERENVNMNLNYRYADTTGRELNIDADYGVYDIVSDQLQPNDMYDYPSNGLISRELTNMYTPSNIDISSFKLDYDQNKWKGRLTVGTKISYVQSRNQFDQFDLMHSSGKFPEGNNNFNYKENINAGYANYNRQLKGWMMQLGVRVENTNAKGHSEGRRWNGGSYKTFDSLTKRNYTDVFPSAAVTFNKNPMNQWSVTYSRRIDRPAYQDLNPFEFRLDKYSFMRGNTLLRPQYTNSFGITNTFKYKLNTTLNYSHVNDVFSKLIDVDELDKTKNFMTKKNLATQDIISLNVSYPFQYKNFSSYFNVNTYYSRYKANYGATRTINVDVFAANLYAQNSLKFGKTWTAELSGWVSTPSIWQGTFKSKAMGGMDLGVQKTVLKGKGNLKASFTDVLHTMKWSSTSDYAGQFVKVNGGWESQQFRMNFSYRFGNNQVKAARQRKTAAEEEAKRTQSSSGLGQ